MARSGLTEGQRRVLRAAPIGLDIDHGNGDPHVGPRFIYHGADGRSASALWNRGLLRYEPIGYGAEGGTLRLTQAGRSCLEEERGR